MRRLVVGLAIISLAALALSWAQADDQEIAKEITERLKQEQKVGHLRDFNINLKVADGNVLLKGHVTSQEQQKLALETARSAKGVKHVVSDLQITAATPAPDTAKTAADTFAAEASADGSPISDSRIGEQLSAELKRRKDAGELKGFGLGISVNKGVVVLRGRVSSAEQLQLALDAAKQAPGVRDVVSHVVVVADVAPQDNLPSSEATNPVATGKEWRDEEISQQIAMAVKAQKAAGKLKGFDIDLAVEKGVATYTGQVATAEQMRLAVDLARQTSGVRDVVNKLVIAPPAPPAKEEMAKLQAVTASPAKVAAPTDAEISRSLATALQKQKAAGKLKGFDLDLSVQEGVVVYTGRVASQEQLQLALDLARQTAGVRDVVNQLTIVEAPARRLPAETEAAQTAPAPQVVPSDGEITHRIANRLKEQQATGSLKGFDIDTVVENGIVTYTGHVANGGQLQTALAIAQQTDGVRDVVNQMIVAEVVPPTPRVDLPEEVAAPPTQTTARLVASERPMNPAPKKAAAQPILTPVGYHSERSDSPAIDYTAEDRRIGQELTAGLDEAKYNGYLRGFGISVRVERGKVGLQGRVSSAEQRQLVAEIARSVSGVSQITNDLLVVNGTGPVPAPRPLGPVQTAAYLGGGALAAPFVAISQIAEGSPIPAHMPSPGAAQVPARYDHPNLPGYAWPSYAAYPNYAAVTYPKQYSPTAWPYIGPFYPYPQVPLGWRKVTLKWDDGWWQLNFKSK